MKIVDLSQENMNFQKTDMRSDKSCGEDDPPDLSSTPQLVPAPQFVIDVIRKSKQWTTREEAQVRAAAQSAFQHSACQHISASSSEMSPPEMVIVLADGAFIQTLNARFRGIDRPTNVLAFPADESFLLGDVFLARDVLLREAEEQNISPYAHLAHLAAHGTLHLLGFDHDDDQKAEIMESLEAAILAKLDFEKSC